MGYWAPRETIRLHLRRIDPDGINERCVLACLWLVGVNAERPSLSY